MARQLDFYFDCSSPWTYLAFHAVQPLAAELGAEIAWKPILVGGVFNAVNQTVYDTRTKPNPLKQSYKLVPYSSAAFEAYWGDDRDIAREEVLADIAAKAGLDRQRFFAAIETDACKQKLRANTDELMARGGFGSPTMFVGGAMFFGNDRLPLVKAALEAA